MSEGVITALIAAAVAVGGVIGKLISDRKTVSVSEQQLLDKKRGDFHQEVVTQLERETKAKDACHEREQELRRLLWQAITKAEEATEEAESNSIHFRPEWES